MQRHSRWPTVSIREYIRTLKNRIKRKKNRVISFVKQIYLLLVNLRLGGSFDSPLSQDSILSGTRALEVSNEVLAVSGLLETSENHFGTLFDKQRRTEDL